MKFFQKKLNKLKNFKIIDDLPLKVDIYIEGMEPIRGVPIEVTGRRSYELYFIGEDPRTAQKRKYQLAIIADVYQQGISKIVSFESQLIMTNQSDHNIDIAYLLLTDENRHLEEVEKEDIDQALVDYQEQGLIEGKFTYIFYSSRHG